jgi:hypothetical protein
MVKNTKNVSWTDKKVRYPTVAILGFLMPLYQTEAAALIFAVSQAIKVSSNLAIGASYIGAMAAALLFAYSICGDISDFLDGLKFAQRAPIYLIGAVVGLKVFWSEVGGMPNVGSDAIIATIISIILIAAGMTYAFYRNDWKLQ